MPRFKDQAVCIRHVDFSESSQVVVLLTKDHGKVRGLAKGSRRLAPSSIQRFSGGIELLTVGQVVAATKRTSELATLTEWDLHDDSHGLRQDLTAQRLAMYAADVTHALLPDLDPHPAVFEAFVSLLNAVSVKEHSGQHATALLRFQWALLSDAGYQPQLDRDVRADTDLTDAASYTFDPHAGGFTTDTGVTDWRVRHATLETLRELASGSSPTDTQAASRANRLLCSYTRALLDRELPTMEVVLG